MRLPFNDSTFPWRVKKLASLIAADDGAGLAQFLKKFPKAVEWEEIHGPNHQTFVHMAVQDQKYKAAEALLDAGARHDLRGIGGGTLVENALRISYADLPPMDAADKAFVENLLARGADINQHDNRGFSPLKTAAWGGKLDTVKFILDHGADPDTGAEQPDGFRHTLLMDIVAHSGWQVNIGNAGQMVDLLLAAGADVNRADEFGKTPLHHAADTMVVQKLLEAGANPEHVDKQGRNVWHAPRDPNDPVCQFIRQAAETLQAARQAQALDKDVTAACHDGVEAKPVRRIRLKNTP